MENRELSKRKRNGRKGSKIVLVVIVFLAALICAAGWFYIRYLAEGDSNTEKNFSDSVSSEFSKPPYPPAGLMRMEGMETSYNYSSTRELRKKLDKYKKAAVEDEDGTWETLKEDDFIFTGDSRTKGFESFGLLPKKQVYAEVGITTPAIYGYLNKIISKHPKRILIAYGINDISEGIWSSPEEYIEEYEKIIKKIRESLPDVEIYVNGIFPVTDGAIKLKPNWKEVPKYNEALEHMCAELKVGFVDVRNLAEEHKEIYSGDGIHFNGDKYVYWAAEILAEREVYRIMYGDAKGN